MNQVAEKFTESFEHAKGNYNSPGWQRFKKNSGKSFGHSPREIEGHAVKRPAKSKASKFKTGERIFHQKFGYGTIETVDGTKLEVAFEKAGKKKVLDGFVERT